MIKLGINTNCFTINYTKGNNIIGSLKLINEEDLISNGKFTIKEGVGVSGVNIGINSNCSIEGYGNIILNITQTSVFGNSIIDTMYNQIDFLRDKQVLDIKGQINKIPNKVSIVSVLFVVPLILLLVLGPFLISFIS